MTSSQDATSPATTAAELRVGRYVVGALFLINGLLIGVWASRIPAITVQYDLTPAMLGTMLLVLASGAVMAFPVGGF